MSIGDTIDGKIGTQPIVRQFKGLGDRAPRNARGKTVRYDARIDATGKPIASSVQVTGIENAGFGRTLQKAFATYQFYPATIDGCPVEGAFIGFARVDSTGHVSGPAAPSQFAAHTVTLGVGPECADVRERARNNALRSDEKLTPPIASSVVLPPIPVPAKAKGKSYVYSVRVDSSGHMIDSTATLTTVEPASYHKKMLATFKSTVIRPARVGLCAVEATFSLTLRL